MSKTSTKFFAGAFLMIVLLSVLSNAQNTIVTVAGGGPNNMQAVTSSIGQPYGVAGDPYGDFYIADYQTNRVFKVDASGNLTVFAGNSVAGYSGDGGLAVNAELYDPEGLAVDTWGNVYIADYANCVIREVFAGSGIITTVAGTPNACGYGGDYGPATSAYLSLPQGVAVDSAGDIFIADTYNSVIREVIGGTIYTVAGNGSAGYSGDGGAATSAQLNVPEGVSVDGSGNLFIADTDNSAIREVTSGNISTVAGTPASFGYSGDGGLATSAQLGFPFSVFVDPYGNIFIADTSNAVIREVSAGVIQTVAGNYSGSGYSGDGGPATSAGLSGPQAVWVDSSGNMFIADSWNYVVRWVSGGTIQTIAGNHTLIYSGNGNPANNAELGYSKGLAVDNSGNIYIADTWNCVIRRVDAVTNLVSTFAGTGVCGYSGDGGPASSAQLNLPEDVFLDSAGNVFIADSNNAIIREVDASSGNIVTVAGNAALGYGYTGDGGPATSAQLSFPVGVAVDAKGDIFITDPQNNVIREVSGTTQIITTIAGTSVGGFNGDNIPATSAQIYVPIGIFVDYFGNVFFADQTNARIREIVAKTGLIQTVAGNGTAGYTGDNGPATGAELDTPWGIYVDPLGDIFISQASLSNPVIREVNGSTGTIHTVGGTGVYGFSGDNGPALSAQISQPIGLAVDRNGNLLFSDYQAMRVRRISALAAVFANTSTALNSSANPSSSGQSVTLTATVTSGAGNIPTGTVNFLDGTTTIGSGSLDATGTITYTSSTLVAGLHSITASYAGDSMDNQSTSNVLSQTVNASTYSVSANPTSVTVTAGKSVSATITATPQGSFTSKITFSCSGLPTLAACTFTPTAITPNANAVSTTVTISTAAASARLGSPIWPHETGSLSAIWIFLPAMLLGFVSLAAPKQRKLLVCALACVIATGCVLQTACTTVNNSGGGGTSGGTPAGTYAITITGSAGSNAQTTTLTLTVQ